VRTPSVGIGTLLVLATSSCGSDSTPNAIAGGDVEAFIEHLDATVPQLLDEHADPGATVALVHDGDVVWTDAYGVRDTTTEEPMLTSRSATIRKVRSGTSPSPEPCGLGETA
jgi:CubicO group peptidase (beta-lactamase class C family)